ncbi:Vacuolar protein sorting-associated protein 33A [Entamoeba marina]
MSQVPRQQQQQPKGIQSKIGTHFQSIFLPTIQLITRPTTTDILKTYQDFTTDTLLRSLPLRAPKQKIIVCDKRSFSYVELITGQYLQDENYGIIDMVIYEDIPVVDFVQKFFRDKFMYIIITDSTMDSAVNVIDYLQSAKKEYDAIAKNPIDINPNMFYLYRLPKFTQFDGKLLDPYKNMFRINKLDIPLAILQDDLFSMQQDNSFVRLYGELFSRGLYSHQLADMMDTKKDNEQYNKEIDFCYIVDRTFDLLTPLLYASNYESLIDQTFGVNEDCTTVDIDMKYFDKTYGKTKSDEPLYKILSPKGKGLLPLHGNWYNETRSVFFPQVPKIFSEKIKATKELKQRSEEEKSITKKIDMTTHFNICFTFVTLHPQIFHTISNLTNTYDFLEIMDKQFQFYDSLFSSSKQISNFFKQDIATPIQELLLLGKHEEALRQFALLCAGFDGLKPDVFNELKKFFIHFCGVTAVNLFAKMELSGVLKKTGEKQRSYNSINSAIRLYEKDSETLYGGYTPFITKSLEALATPNAEDSKDKNILSMSLKSVSKIVSKNLVDILPEDEQLKTTLIKEKIEGNPNKIVVFVIGGISYGEIATLRLLSQKLNRQIIIGSTHIIRKTIQ